VAAPEFTLHRLDQLSARQLHAVLAAREAVFVVEQHCAYQEVDRLDLHAWHLTGWYDDEVVAYLRIVDPGRKYAEPSIGRVLTSLAYRRAGLGKRLMIEGLRQCAAHFPECGIRISAQLRLQSFYEDFGFQAVSASYLEDGVDHVEMLRPPGRSAVAD